MGGLVWTTFPSASFLDWDSIKSIRLDFGLRCIPISLSIGENGGPRSRVEGPRDKDQLKTLNLSPESAISTTSSSFMLVGREEVATPVVCCSGKATLGTPSRMG